MSTSPPTPEATEQSLKRALKDDGPKGVIAYIQALPESQRLKAYQLAQTTFGVRSAGAPPLDDYVTVVRAGIAEALRRSADETDPERSAGLKDTANVFSFNLLADLAECWPNDSTPRERRHFEEGLRAAEDCIRWREELGKPNDRKAMAWWGKGMHLLSLERNAEAVEAFGTATSLVHTTQDFVASPEASFGELLYPGYLALGRLALGEAGAEADLAAVRSAFEAQLHSDDEETREDAQIGLEQLEVVEQKLRSRDGV